MIKITKWMKDRNFKNVLLPLKVWQTMHIKNVWVMQISLLCILPMRHFFLVICGRKPMVWVMKHESMWFLTANKNFEDDLFFLNFTNFSSSEADFLMLSVWLYYTSTCTHQWNRMYFWQKNWTCINKLWWTQILRESILDSQFPNTNNTNHHKTQIIS